MRSLQSTLFTLLAASNTVFAETTLNLPEGVSPISHDVYDLHMLIFWVCVVIGVIVFGAMFYSIIHHRKSKGHKAAQFHSHLGVEIAWTIVPVIILVIMAIPATKVLFNMNNEDKSDMTIKITGYQWKWHYEYLEDNISFFSNLSTPFAQIHNQAPKGVDYLREVDNPLVLPIHTKVRLLITSNDVNHAWWVPDFAVKRDAVGGFINEAWVIIDKPGTYRGQCAELCGINHAFMPIVVIAKSEQGYKDWVAQQKGQATQGATDIVRPWTKNELMENGTQVYNRICAACHQPGGVGLPPTFPALKGSKIATGPIAKHIDTVMNGVNGTAMQAFKNQLSEVDLASVITYERNSWGNTAGDMVQPIQVQAYKNGKSITDALNTKPQEGTAIPTKPAATQTTQPATATPAPGAALQAVPAQPTAAALPEDLPSAMGRGEKVYLSTCVACHQVAGTGLPPTFPSLKGSPIVTGPVTGHIERVMNGKQGTSMVAFKDQLKDQEIADVITYERNAWGNNTGTIVTPAQIATARNPNAQTATPAATTQQKPAAAPAQVVPVNVQPAVQPQN